MEVSNMSDSPYAIKIALPLKNWGKCGHSFEANKNYCKSKIFGYEVALNKLSGIQCFNSSFNELLQLYRLCFDILVLAETHNALLTSLYPERKGGTVFEFKFAREKACDEFYQELIESFKSYSLVDVTKS